MRLRGAHELCTSVKSSIDVYAWFSSVVSFQTSNIVRVPFEVTKQRAQANRNSRPLHIARHTWRNEV